MNVKFEWDPKKAAANVVKHGVSFEEGMTVFKDPLGRVFDDEDHSRDEARERQRSENGKTMKKPSSRRKPGREEMRPEYRFDYRKARSNRFAPLMKGQTVAVVLDPDVAAVFQSSESVNSLLRSVISAIPTRAGANKPVQPTRDKAARG